MKKEWIKLAIGSAFLLVLISILFFLSKEEENLLEENGEDSELYLSKLESDKESIVRIHLEKSNLLFEKAQSKSKNNLDSWTLSKETLSKERKQYPIDQTELGSLIETLSGFKAEEHLVEIRENLESFGLEPAVSSYRFWTQNNEEYHFLKGNPTPVGNTVYMQKKGSEGIYVVPELDLEVLDQGLDEFRQKDFLQIEESELLSIRFRDSTFIRSSKSAVPLVLLPKELSFPSDIQEFIQFEGKEERLTFEGSMSRDQKEQLLGLSENIEYQNAIEDLFEESNQENWTVNSSKKEESLNTENINTWVNDLLNIRAVGFLDDPKNIPAPSLLLELESESETIALRLCSLQDKYYAQIENQNTLYEILDHLYQGLDKPIQYFYESNDSAQVKEQLELEPEE